MQLIAQWRTNSFGNSGSWFQFWKPFLSCMQWSMNTNKATMSTFFILILSSSLCLYHSWFSSSEQRQLRLSCASCQISEHSGAGGFKYSQAGKAWVLPLLAIVLATGCPTNVGLTLSDQCELPFPVSEGCLSHFLICSKHIDWLYLIGEFRWR